MGSTKIDIRPLEGSAVRLRTHSAGRKPPSSESKEVKDAVDKARAEFLTLVSHELRTPLAAIKGSVELLNRRAELPEDTTEKLIEATTRNVERLEGLVNDLLAASGQLENQGSTETVDIADVISERVHALLEGDPRVSMLIRHDGLLVSGNRHMLVTAIDQLLDNAAKFCPSDGRIWIHVERDGYTVRLTITNDGPHIHPWDRERIFDPFVIFEDVLTRNTRGMGLGLSIVRRVVEQIGGAVWVTGEPGHGTAFHLRMPLDVQAVLLRSS